MATNPWKRTLCNLDLLLAVVCLACLITLTFVGVFMRYLFNNPIAWQDEIQMTLIVWVTCFAGSAAFRTGGHIAIDLVVDLFPKAVQRWMSIVIFLISAFVLGFLAWNSMGFVMQQIGNHRVTDVLKFPRALVYAPVPLCSVLMILSFAGTTWREFHEKEALSDAG